jgi:hypothetical protein
VGGDMTEELLGRSTARPRWVCAMSSSGKA